MKKFFYILFFVILAVTLIEAGYLYFSLSQPLPFSTSQTADSRVFSLVSTPTSSPVAKFEVVYQKEGDTQGRTIIFAQDTPSRLHGGVGVIALPNKTENISYVVGLFKEWQEIRDSQDRYLILEDPLKKQSLPPFRILFTPSFIAGAGPAKRNTGLAVENISQIYQGIEDGAVEGILPMGKLTSDQMDDLIKVGDALVLLPFERRETIVKDEAGNPVVWWVVLRRHQGKEAIERILP